MIKAEQVYTEMFRDILRSLTDVKERARAANHMIFLIAESRLYMPELFAHCRKISSVGFIINNSYYIDNREL